MGAGICTSKTVLLLIGLLFWGIAGGLGYIGGWILKDYGHIDEIAKSYYTVVPGAVLIGAAALMFMVGILICGSACAKGRCLLACVFCVLLTIFLAQISAAVLGYAYRGKVESMLHDGMKDAIDHYGFKNHTEVTSQVDYIQREFDCCGVCNYTDWFNSPWAHSDNGTHELHVPASCCFNSTTCIGSTQGFPAHPLEKNVTLGVDQQGCLKKLHKNMVHDLGIIVGVGVAFALLMIFGMVSACVLLCRTRQEAPYESLGQRVRGLRV